MIFQLPEEADVAVCGAGPAGLLAARHLAQAGLSVILLDRRDPWSEPVSCAEAVHAQGLLKWAGEIDPEWVRGPVDGVIFVSPDGTRVAYEQPKSGLILDRAKLHKSLAQKAVDQGAKIHFRANVTSLEPTGNKWHVHGLTEGRTPFVISVRAVVDASGAGGKLTNGLPGFESIEDGAHDLETGVFAILEGVEHSQNLIELDFGSKYFPGGYGWVFPRDGHSANVGIVIGRDYASKMPVRKLLQQWVAYRWPTVQIENVYGGAIACGQSRKALALNGIFKAGDSASQVNPISRSGIVEGMKGGVLVARALIKWLDATEIGEKKAIEDNLLVDWFREQGSIHERLFRAKNAFASIPDKVFNKAAHRIVTIPLAKRSLPRIFFSTLIGSPTLLWRMRSLMGL